MFAALLLAFLALPATAPATAVSPSPADPDSLPFGEAGPTGISPSPAPTPRPPEFDPLPKSLIVTFPLTVSGSADPGDTIAVSGGSGSNRDTTCTATTGDDGRFSCALRQLPDGPGIPVRAESTASGLADSGRVEVLSPPVVTTANGTATGGGIRGTAYPGATVTVTADTGAHCTFPADADGGWGCVLTGIADGRHTVTARQVAPFSPEPSARSAAVTIIVDTTAPPAPTLHSPAPGTSVEQGQPIAFAGTGEDGDQISVYALRSSDTIVACTAMVISSAWSCRATLPPGGYIARALQRDAAGNVSAGSRPVALTVVTATPPAPAGTDSPTPRPAPSPTPSSPAVPTSPDLPAPSHPDTRGWVETPFSTAVAPVVSAASIPGWLRSLTLAVAALLLLALPARLLAAVLTRGRAEGRGSPRPTLFGRNRTRAELGEVDTLLGRRENDGENDGEEAPARPQAQPVWLIPLVGAVAATLVTLSTAVQDLAAYARLLFAVVIAVSAVNAVWVLSAREMARHLGLGLPRVVVRPRMLALVAVAALGSRLLGLEPALLFGIVLGVKLAPHTTRVQRGRIAAVRLSTVAALGVLAWLTVGVLPAPSGAVSAFFVELANALALVGVGSTAIALLPLGGFAGRAVFQWSRAVWLGLSVVVDTVLFALLLPVASLVETGGGLLAAVVAALAFAALSVSVWLWERYVEPAR